MPSKPGPSADSLSRLMSRLENNFAQSRALASFSARTQKKPILASALDDVYELFRGLIPFDRLGLALIDETGKIARAVWVRSEGGPRVLKPGYAASIQRSSLKRVFDERKPRIISNLLNYSKAKPESESTRLILKEGMLSSLTCPLFSGDDPLGFLFFSSRRSDAYQPEHGQIFLQIAAELSALIEKSKLYNDLIELRRFKYQFMGMAAHDISGPLKTTHSLTRLLLSGSLGPLNSTQADALKRMEEDHRSILKILTELIDFTEIEMGPLKLDKEDVNTEEFLKEILETRRILARSKNIQLEFRKTTDLPFLRLDRPRMRQAIENLLSNAVKFSYENSKVILEGDWKEDRVFFRVIDAGKGIGEKDLRKIFQEFGRGAIRPTGGETQIGLGLVVVKKIVEAHGGALEIESELDRGSIFSIVLPTREED